MCVFGFDVANYKRSVVLPQKVLIFVEKCLVARVFAMYMGRGIYYSPGIETHVTSKCAAGPGMSRWILSHIPLGIPLTRSDAR